MQPKELLCAFDHDEESFYDFVKELLREPPPSDVSKAIRAKIRELETAASSAVRNKHMILLLLKKCFLPFWSP